MIIKLVNIAIQKIAKTHPKTENNIVLKYEFEFNPICF